MKYLYTSMLAMLLATTGAFAADDDDNVVNVYNWAEYMSEEMVENFERDTGIKANLDYFDSLETMETVLLTGNSGYDVAFPSSFLIPRHKMAGLYEPFDKSKMPNLENVKQWHRDNMAIHDPGEAYFAGYMWGSTGYAYNKDKIADRLGADAPTDSWEMMFNAAYTEKLASCGLTHLDAPTDVYNMVFHYLDIPGDTENPEDFKRANELLLPTRPHIKYFKNYQYPDDLGTGETCISTGWSGSMVWARYIAKTAGSGVELIYVIPKEGADLWYDGMSIPVGAPHLDNAHAFINYMLKPESMALNTNYSWYANVVPAAYDFMDDFVRTEPDLYPSDERIAKTSTMLVQSPKAVRLTTRSWTSFKTGI